MKMKPPVIQSADWFEKSRPPVPEEPIEERVLRLEKVVEVLRQELISQNRKLEQLRALLAMPVPAQPRERR